MVHIFCALFCEAGPLIRHYQLTECALKGAFRLFRSEDKEINLCLTKIGAQNAEKAVQYLKTTVNATESNIWLNIGIAGHRSLPIGTPCLADKVTGADHASWYPPLLFTAPCQTAPLITLNKPSSDYQDALYDMEAAGFYAAAARTGTIELIQCLKIVSDNTGQSTDKINKAMVSELIADNIVIIDAVIDCLKPLAAELATLTTPPAGYQELIDRWHFTATEKTQLQRLLTTQAVRRLDGDLLQSLKRLHSGKAVLKHLRDDLRKTPFLIHD